MSKINQEECLKRFYNAHGNKYDYSKVKYTNSHSKVYITCPKHGEFFQTARLHWNGAGCPKCANKNVTTEEFIEKAREVHGDKYDYSKVEYINNFTKVCIICPIHGEFWQRPDNHLEKNGCRKCGNERIAKSKALTEEEFIAKAREIHGDKYDYSKVKYINNYTPIEIICNKCGNIFYQKPIKHLINHGCPKCNSSHLEEEIRLFFQEKNIEFEEQKRFKWLGKQSLDFYLPEYNIGIECQGIQHFKPKSFTTMPKEEMVKEYQNIQKRDKTKKELCKKNGLKILYYSNLGIDYPYDVFENKEQLLKEINNN